MGKQAGFLTSSILFFPFCLVLIYISSTLHYTLPTPSTQEFDSNGTPIFCETKAMEFIKHLAVYEDGSPRYRIVGTEEMVDSEEYLMSEINKIKAEVEATMTKGLHQIELFHQTGDGSHLFEFMDKQVWKKYYNITNVIVRLSDGTAASKANAVLLNAHLDSTLPSPGAADDLVGVAVMLETLRVMALSPRRLTNSVVFLFNGAEESLQDASHLFITQHPLRKTIRSVINLEACGVSGKEIVFQATSTEMINALKKATNVYGSIIATEVFGTGVILSDTDYRQFAKYGNLTGLDLALVQNSYLYHTRLDLPERIEPGALQHFGENIIALCEYLTSPETTMGNSFDALPLEKSTGSTIFFSALGGYFFIVYSAEQATLIYGALIALVAIVVSNRIDFERKKVYAVGVIGVGFSLLGALVAGNLAAWITGTLMNKTMTWFRHEAFAILIYGPPAFLGTLLSQRIIAFFIRTPNANPLLAASESSLLEHSALVGQLIYYSIALAIGHFFKIGSSYLFALSIFTALIALVLNDFILCRGKERRVHLAAYFVGQVTPLLFGIEGLVGFLDLFVPLTGRIGEDAPVDYIIASLVCGVGFLSIPMALPLSHRYGSAVTSRMIIVLLFISAGTIGWFVRPKWNVYDHDHPKRLLVLHLENVTTTPSVFDLHIASVDPVPFYDLVLQSTLGLGPEGVLPEKLQPSEERTQWNFIFPVDEFLTSYKIPLPTTVAVDSSHPWKETFTLTSTRSVLNAIKQTRSLEIRMDHPGLIWTVMSFNADIVSWDLPEEAERGLIRHHVKSVASWGVSKFTLALTIQLSPEQFEAAMREDQRAKEQRGDVSVEDQVLGGLKVDFSGLDLHGMYPASSKHPSSGPGMTFFKELDAQLPDYVDAMLVSAVAAVAYV